jgi:predicted DNA-binding transcriptional regulator AlpA
MPRKKHREPATPLSDKSSAGIPRLMVAAEDAAWTISVSKSTWDRMASAGKVPKPVRLSPGCVRWLVSDLDLWAEMECPDQNEFEARRSKHD